MKQLNNFLSKREQSRVCSGFAECEKSRLKAKLLMTLVALLAMATGAWAQTGENIFQYCYDCQRDPAYPTTSESASLEGFANPLVGYKGTGFGMDNTSDGPWKLEYMGLWSTTNNHGIDNVSDYQDTYNCTDVPVFRLYQWNATANEYQHAAYGVVCCYAKVSNAIEHTALFVAEGGWGCVLTNSSHSSSMNITFDEDLTTGLTTLIAAATPGITFTRGTGEHSNEWTMDGGMPAGNVLLTVLYKDSTTTSVTFDESTITVESTAEERSVTAAMGFEAYFVSQLAASVKNITADTTVVNPTLTYTSSNTSVIAFQTDQISTAASGPLNMMRFMDTGTATLTVEYAGTDDIAKSSVDLLVTVAQPATLTVESSETELGTVEAVVTKPIETTELNLTDIQSWSGDNTTITADDLPGFQSILNTQAKTWTEAPATGTAYLAYAFDQSGTSLKDMFINGVWDGVNIYSKRSLIYELIDGGAKFYYTTGVNPVNILATSAADTYTVVPGAQVTLTATAVEGYHVEGWKKGTADVTEGITYSDYADEENSLNPATSTLTVALNGNETYTAVFAVNKFNVIFDLTNAPVEDKAAGVWTANPSTNVDQGTTITVTYTGQRKVIGVKAEKKSDAKTLAEATSEDIGKIAGKDGKIYATKADAEAVATGNAVAMIAYVGTASDCAHGLAIALEDVSNEQLTWDNSGNNNDSKTAAEWCSAWNTSKAVTGGTWRLPSDKDWQYMFIGCGSGESYSAPTYYPQISKSYSGLASKLTTAQGAALLQSAPYWSSTEDNSNGAWFVLFNGSNATFYMETKDSGHQVRACLAF